MNIQLTKTAVKHKLLGLETCGLILHILVVAGCVGGREKWFVQSTNNLSQYTGCLHVPLMA